jgi:hypothetical protein
VIYLWKIPDDYPASLIGTYDKDRSPDRFLFIQGQRFGKSPDVPSFTFSAKSESLRKYDVLPNSTMIPLVSARVAKILEQLCQGDVELIPANVSARDEKLEDYSLLNILPRVASVDHSASKFVCIPGTTQIMKFTELTVRPNALGSHHLAREKEYKSFILVSETLKGRFESERVTGHVCVPSHEFKM